jgi:hypothetical protein
VEIPLAAMVEVEATVGTILPTVAVRMLGVAIINLEVLVATTILVEVVVKEVEIAIMTISGDMVVEEIIIEEQVINFVEGIPIVAEGEQATTLARGELLVVTRITTRIRILTKDSKGGKIL